MIRILIDRLHALEKKRYISAAGLSTDEKPTNNLITGSVFCEIDTGKTYRFDEASSSWLEQSSDAGAIESGRVTPLEGTALTGGVIDAIGIPEYVADAAQYAAYGITDTGWYVFARISVPQGTAVGAETTVTGADGVIAESGADHLDVAIRFEVASTSKSVIVVWEAGTTETFVFRAVDLAVRNLDYRTTFYLYDIAPFTTWSYTLTTDETFAEGKDYYTEADGVYTLAEVTAGDAVPADTYYNHSLLTFQGMTRNVTYKLDTIVDCPIEIVLPEIPEDGYGAWFEIQLRYKDTYSCTLLPPEGVKIGTASTQAQSGGINTIDLQYTAVGGVQMWTLLNTHSNIPA